MCFNIYIYIIIYIYVFILPNGESPLDLRSWGPPPQVLGGTRGLEGSIYSLTGSPHMYIYIYIYIYTYVYI